DVDNLSVLPDLRKKLPEITRTTRVKTNRGYHYYFNLNNNTVKSTSALFGERLELKSNGNYIVAPPSVINNHRYTYEVPLDNMLPIPAILTTNNKVNKIFPEKNTIFKIPKYYGHKMDCIRQILKRDLKEGERNNSLFILYNLLLQNKNTEEHTRKIVVNKNRLLAYPLTVKELKKIYRKPYHYGCSGIRGKLPYVNCEECTYCFKGGQFRSKNILFRNLRLLPELTNTQRGIACLLGTVFDGENPSISRIAKEAHMDWRVVKKAIRELKEKGFPLK
ncbi:MAG: bifunctional DNA primase/polymerase, partial [Thermotogota bacterium]|nr:bifunctional DNA primase/polymerase [Thermotogota bacterium]